MDAWNITTTNEGERQRSAYANASVRLNKLPPELRNKIWHLVLPTNKIQDTRREAHFTLVEPGRYEVDYRWLGRDPAAITRVCRSIRNETLSILYGSNDFIIHLDSAPYLNAQTDWDHNEAGIEVQEAKYWLRSRSDLAIQALRSLCFMLPPWGLGLYSPGHDEEALCRTLVHVDLIARKAEVWSIDGSCTMGHASDTESIRESIPGKVGACITLRLSGLAARQRNW